MTGKNVVRALLRQKRMTQDKLAEAVGLKNGGNVSAMLNGRTNLSTIRFIRMMDAMGVDVVVYDLTTHRKFRISEDGLMIKPVIRMLMAEKRITQKWLAQQLDVSQSSISSATFGKSHNVRLSRVVDILEMMGCVLSVYDRDTGNAFEVNNIEEDYLTY